MDAVRKYWVERTDKENSDTWLEVRDPDGWYTAIVKWDGCIHYHGYSNQPFDSPTRNPADESYIHICDIDDEIKRLQALKKKALQYFGEWPR